MLSTQHDLTSYFKILVFGPGGVRTRDAPYGSLALYQTELHQLSWPAGGYSYTLRNIDPVYKSTTCIEWLGLD